MARDTGVITQKKVIGALLEAQPRIRGILDLIQASIWDDDNLSWKVLEAVSTIGILQMC